MRILFCTPQFRWYKHPSQALLFHRMVRIFVLCSSGARVHPCVVCVLVLLQSTLVLQCRHSLFMIALIMRTKIRS